MMRWIGLLPGLLTLTLTALLTRQWLLWTPTPPVAAPGAAAGPVVNGSPETDPLALAPSPESRERDAGVTERPLFRPDRRPPPGPEELTAESSPPPAPPASLDHLDLTAVLLAPGLQSAWVRDPSQPKPRRLRIGDEVDGWSVRSILPDRLLLERQGAPNTLLLRNFAKANPASPPLQVPPRPVPARGQPPSAPTAP